MTPAEPVRAPAGAYAWTPADGWLFEPDVSRRAVTTGALVLVVSDDGYVHGIQLHDLAPLVAVLRVDSDLAEVVQRLGDLADQVAGIDTAEATDTNELRARVTALVHRVDRLEGGTP